MTIFWHSFIAPAERPTGDGRRFADAALRPRLPLPLPLQATSATGHGHAGAETVGRLDGMYPSVAHGDGPDDQPAGWEAFGTFMDPARVPEAAKAIYLAQQQVSRPSVDLEPGTFTMSVRFDDEGRQEQYFTEAVVAGVTLVPMPAFSSVHITVDDPSERVLLASLGVEADLDFAVNSSSWRHLPIATRKASFNADDAIKRIAAWSGLGTEDASVERYASAFLWRDGNQTGDTFAQDSFRLPLGDIIDGKLVMIYHAVYAAAALIAGAHGGVPQIPENDRRRIQSVVNDIYAKFREEFTDEALRSPFEGGGRAGNGNATTAALDEGEGALTAAGGTGNGNRAMIALVPTAGDTTRLTVEGGLPPDDLHCTLLYLGDADAYGPSDQLLITHEGMVTAAHLDGPIITDAFATATFNPTSDEPCGVVLLSGEGLEEACDSVYQGIAALAQVRHLPIPEPKTPWVAHTTLTYDPPASLQAWNEKLGTITFDRVRVAFGNNVRDFPIEVGTPMDDTVTAGAGPATLPPKRWFVDPRLSTFTPITITDDGHVFGHLARWGQCHLGVGDRCVLAPRSKTNYAYFRLGVEKVDDGSFVRVGKITVGAGHAHPSLGVVPAREHYDNVAWAAVSCTAGEDQFGVWLNGVVTDPSKVPELRRSPLSGDWRRADGNLELVAALAVNSPGFPVLRMEDGNEFSLVASAGDFVADEVVEPQMSTLPDYPGGTRMVDEAQLDRGQTWEQMRRSWELDAILRPPVKSS